MKVHESYWIDLGRKGWERWTCSNCSLEYRLAPFFETGIAAYPELECRCGLTLEPSPNNSSEEIYTWLYTVVREPGTEMTRIQLLWEVEKKFSKRVEVKHPVNNFQEALTSLWTTGESETQDDWDEVDRALGERRGND